MKNLVVIVFIFLLPQLNYGQQCGAKVPMLPRPINIEKIIKASPDKKQNNRKVALSVHVIESRFTAIDITPEKLEEDLAYVNEYFEDSGMEFFMCGTARYIDGDRVYSYSQADDLNKTYHTPGTINVYIIDKLVTEESTAICGSSFFPWDGNPLQRYITISKNCTYKGITLAHELGHFFGLFHTHETFMGREYVDGSNCTTAGDGICDTPADPQLGPHNLSNCIYSGIQLDPKGNRYQLDGSNIMSYAPDMCINKFSTQQKRIMSFFLEEDNFLTSRCEDLPDFTLVNSQEQLTTRSDQTISLTYQIDNIGVNESKDLEIHFYLSEDVTTDVVPLAIKKISATELGSNLTKDLDINIPIETNSGDYKLTAFLDPSYSLFEADKRNNVATIDLKVDNSTLDNEILFSSITSDYIKLYFLKKDPNQKSLISIFDSAGQLISIIKDETFSQEFFKRIDISSLPQGVYFLNTRFESELGNKSFKFIKMN